MAGFLLYRCASIGRNHNMKVKGTAALLALALSAAAAQVSAATITTLFASNNGGAIGGGIYFDVSVFSPNGITIEKLAINTPDLGALSLNIYTRSGTASGFEKSLTGWSLVSTGSGSGLGMNNPSSVEVTDFVLGPGLWGIAMDADNFGWDYTNGTGFGGGGNQLFVNADLALIMGSAMNVPFVSGTVFGPRVWNGTIEYSANSPSFTVTEPAGLGLLGIAGAALVSIRRRRSA